MIEHEGREYHPVYEYASGSNLYRVYLDPNNLSGDAILKHRLCDEFNEDDPLYFVYPDASEALGTLKNLVLANVSRQIAEDMITIENYIKLAENNEKLINANKN